jgi:IclR family KDG regulon transcriptional repressor
MEKNRYSVPSLERALDILDLIAVNKDPLRFEEILKKSGMHRSTGFRVLSTLEYKGYIEKIDSSKNTKWRLGKRMLKIGIDHLINMDIRIESKPTMQWLADKSNEMVQLGILFNGQVMYIDQIKQAKPLTIYSEPGSLLPINISASGMVLASNLTEQQVIAIINEHKFKKNTVNTITDQEEYLKLLHTVRAQQFAVDNEMYATGIRCIAAPIYNYSGENVAAIGISGHVSSITDDNMQHLIQLVKEASQQISLRLGYSLN